jgi:hypothetical protein
MVKLTISISVAGVPTSPPLRKQYAKYFLYNYLFISNLMNFASVAGVPTSPPLRKQYAASVAGVPTSPPLRKQYAKDFFI